MKNVDRSLEKLRQKYSKLVINTCRRASERYKVLGKTSLKPEEAAVDVMNDVLWVIGTKYLEKDGSLPPEGFPERLFQALATRKASNVFRPKYRNRNTKPLYKGVSSFESTTMYDEDENTDFQLDIEDSLDTYAQQMNIDLLKKIEPILTDRERQVLMMYSNKLKVKDIAEELDVDPKTVLNVRKRISAKLEKLQIPLA